MKKYIVILITIIPILGFGQVTYEKLPQPFGNSTDYSLFRVNCNSLYTSALNKDRASVGRSPVLNSADLNGYAYQRAMFYAEKIVNNPDVYFTKSDPQGIFHYIGSDGNRYGTAHDGMEDMIKNGANFRSENYSGSSEFKVAFPEDVSKIGNDFLSEYKMSYIVEDSGARKKTNVTWSDYISKYWIKNLYKNSQGHLDNRRNTFVLNGGIDCSKYNWKKYGYAIVIVYVKTKHPYYDGLSTISTVIVSYEIFSE